MASKASHIVLRGKVYQYQRRAPQEVLDRPEAFQRLFGAQRTVRRSLKTADYPSALERGAAEERRFDDLVRQALGLPAPAVVAVARNPLTPEALGRVASDMRNRIVR